MPVSFDTPYYLILLPILLVFVVWIGRKGTWQTPFRRKLLTTLRCFLCLVLVLSLSGMGIRQISKKTTTVFVVDRSASTKDAEQQVQAFLSQVSQKASKETPMGVVCFGENAVVEQTPADALPVEGFSSVIQRAGSHIEKAMQTAAAMFTKDSKQRIVLISDGNETAGDAYRTASILSAGGAVVDVYPLETGISDEVQLSAIHLPQAVNKNVAYSIELELYSQTESRAWVKLYKDTSLIVNEEVSLHSGVNRLQFTDKTEAGGNVTYRAEVQSEADTVSQNNVSYANCYITDLPRILLLQNGESGRELRSLLSASGVQVDVMQGGSAPTSADKLASYDGIVLADVPYDSLPEDFDTLLESYVRLTGGGLLVTGGEHSYALGGYYNTVLEEVLPVSMDLKSEEENADVGMVFVIDRSGSMSSGNYGLTKMEMAKEAAIRGVEALTEIDSIGVVTFDSAAEWTVPLQKVGGNETGITDSIAKIQPGGGTSILPGLNMAYEALQQADCRIKHIVLLTDGQAEQSGYDSVMSGIRAGGITLSCVAVGSDADSRLMQTLAEKGNGRYYFTNEFSDLPQIFAKEALLAGKEYLNNRSFHPTASYSALLDGISALPVLDGYIGTTAKPRAEVVLSSDKKEPILASWQYGLGKTVAWTSDVSGKWSANYLGTEEGNRLLQNMVSFMMRTPMTNQVKVEAKAAGEESKIQVAMDYDSTIQSLQATVLSSGNQSYDLALSAVSPGVFEGSIPTTVQGVYSLNLTMTRAGGSETLSTGFALNYAKEYDVSAADNGADLLKQIAYAGGGRVLHGPEEFESQVTGEVFGFYDCTKVLLVLSVLLLLLDIFLRRFSVVLNRLERQLVTKKAEPIPKERKKEPILEKSVEKPAEQPKKETAAPSAKNTSDLLLKNKRKRGN